MMQSRANLNIATAFQMGVAFRLDVEYALHPEIASLIKAKLVQARLITNDAEFKENQHPRDKDGKFKSGKGSQRSIEDVYGPEITLSKPNAKLAIKVLLKHQSGHIKDAVKNKYLGSIDLIWGDNKRGLKHIIESRKKHGQSPEKTLEVLSKILENAKPTLYGDDDRNKVNDYLVYWKGNKGYRVVVTKYVRNSKDANNKIRFVLTAMEITDNKTKWPLIKR